MNALIESPSVFITLLHLVLFQLLIGFMKLLSLVRNSWPEGSLRFFFTSPVPSFRTWKRGSTAEVGNLMKASGVLFVELIVLAGFYSLPSDLFVSDWHWTLQSYVVIVPFVVLVDAAGRFIQVAYGLAGVRIPHIHENFFTVTSLSEFWDHWNVWFADFFDETCFRPFLRRPAIGLIVAFGVSGVFHEYLANLPLYWTYETNLFGTMMLYFFIQAFGLWVERKTPFGRPWLKRTWTWLWVVLPVPLVLNLGSLRIFHLGFFG